MSSREQRELLELYKAMTHSYAEAKNRRIQDVKACGVFLFACWVFCALVALIITKC